MPNQIYYTITHQLDVALCAVARFTDAGMVAGFTNLAFNGRVQHIYVVAGNWMENEDFDADRQGKDIQFLLDQDQTDNIYFDMTWDEKQYLINMMRRGPPRYTGHIYNGPRQLYPIDIWKNLNQYYENPDNGDWIFIAQRNFLIPFSIQ